MPTKTTVAEFRAFYADETVWANQAWYEGVVIVLDGEEISDDLNWDNPEEAPPSEAVITLSGGVLHRPKSKNSSSTLELDFEAVFKRWRNAQTMATVAVSVPKEKVDELRALVKSMGGKVQ